MLISDQDLPSCNTLEHRKLHFLIGPLSWKPGFDLPHYWMHHNCPWVVQVTYNGSPGFISKPHDRYAPVSRVSPVKVFGYPVISQVLYSLHSVGCQYLPSCTHQRAVKALINLQKKTNTSAFMNTQTKENNASHNTHVNSRVFFWLFGNRTHLNCLVKHILHFVICRNYLAVCIFLSPPCLLVPACPIRHSLNSLWKLDSIPC